MHVSQFGIQRMLIIHWVLSDFEWVQTYFSISYRKSLVLFATGGFHGTQRFSGSKYLPPHRGLAMVSVKRAICQALFWDLFTNFHAKFIQIRVLFPSWHVPLKDSEIITTPEANVSAVHVAFQRVSKLERIFSSLLEQMQITKSRNSTLASEDKLSVLVL